MTHSNHDRALRAAWVRSIAVLLIAAIVLFASAGTLAIPEFWSYLAVLAAVSVAGLIGLDPELAAERMRPGGKPLGNWFLLVALMLVAHLAMAGLDRGRLHWSDGVAGTLEAFALALFAAAGLAIVWAMHVNRFFSSVPRIQAERGQRVISTGPYQWVRHPGYAAGIVLAITSGVALGSWLATAIAALAIPLLLRRTVIEDRLLRNELPGYQSYAAQVRYRLMPGVW
jgi:protein-S-isoprenylcysteine O-methyltransferase Ste14